MSVKDNLTPEEIELIAGAAPLQGLPPASQWCNECNGFTHMPYCSHYVDPEAFQNLARRIQASRDVDRAIEATDAEIAANGGTLPGSSFEIDWASAPSAMRHGTEREVAEYFWRKGAESKAAEMVETQNQDLKEMRRVAEARKERLG